MSSNLLQLVQQVTAELNLAVPTYVAGNPNQDVQQILALMNRAGYDLVKEHNWQALELEYRFYTTAITTTCDTINNTYDLLNVANTTGLDNTYSIVGFGNTQIAAVILLQRSSIKRLDLEVLEFCSQHDNGVI